MSSDHVPFKVVKINLMRSGKSGSGKTSVQSLLLRFFDVSIAVDYKYEALTHIVARSRTRYL